VDVAHRRLNRLVAGQLGDLVDFLAGVRQGGTEAMAQAMEGKPLQLDASVRIQDVPVVDVRDAQRLQPGLADVHRLTGLFLGRKDQRVPNLLEALQLVHHARRKVEFPAGAVLTVAQEPETFLEVDVGPAQIQQFAFTGAGHHRHQYQEVKLIPVRLPAGLQQPLTLLIGRMRSRRLLSLSSTTLRTMLVST
jgi:hypothetical protein